MHRPDLASAGVRTWVPLIGFVLVALNLRAGIAAVPPLLPEIRADFGISRSTAGLLTTLPVICFGVLSAAAVALGRRIGTERALLFAMLAIAAGSVLRVLAGSALLFAGTALIGAAITVGNVLGPSVVKEYFPARQGAATGVFMGALIGGAALAAAVSSPLAGAGAGWRGSLLVWAALAVVAALAWVPLSRRRPHRPAAAASPAGSVLREPLTWALCAFMGLQSLLYYAVLTWLPELLEDEGVSLGRAGLALSLFNLCGIVTALGTPSVAARWSDSRALAWILCLGWGAGLAGLLADPDRYLLWSVVAGFAQGAGISLVFALIVLRSRTPDVAGRVSGTVQTVGYLIGAAGPLAAGALRDATGSWSAPLLLLLGVTAVMAVGAAAIRRDAVIG